LRVDLFGSRAGGVGDGGMQYVCVYHLSSSNELIMAQNTMAIPMQIIKIISPPF